MTSPAERKLVLLLVTNRVDVSQRVRNDVAVLNGQRDALLPPLELQAVDDPAEIRAALIAEPGAVLLLDLDLPDGKGLDRLVKLKAHFGDATLIALTGSNEPFARRALRRGAQDYLLLNKPDHDALFHALRYAWERRRWRLELDDLRRHFEQDHEVRTLEELAAAAPGGRETVQRLLHDYSTLARSYVRSTRLNQPRPSTRVQALARRLSRIHASARDVVRLHLDMLNSVGQWSKSSEERAFANDARLALVELMGNLIDLYLDK